MHKSKRSAWPIQHRVYTDHQPLQSIFKKDLTLAPKFLQRILLLLQRYDFTVVYRKGSLLHLADTVSRALCQDEVVNPFMSDTFHMFHVHLVRLDPTSAALIDITREQPRNATSSFSCCYLVIIEQWVTLIFSWTSETLFVCICVSLSLYIFFDEGRCHVTVTSLAHDCITF